jgi:hypothetical protein
VKDELTGFVRSLDQYKGGKGSDRQFWLSAWAGAQAKINRSGTHDAGPIVIPHPFVAVAGMMCPDSFAELRGENRAGDATADGFLDRFLFSFTDPLPATPERWHTIPEHVTNGYNDVFSELLKAELVAVIDRPGSPTHYRPCSIEFTANGRTAWEEFTGNIAARMNALDLFDPFRGVLSKLRGYGLRFAALLWAVRRVCGLVGQNDPIDAEVMVGAALLVDYFERHGPGARPGVGGPPGPCRPPATELVGPPPGPGHLQPHRRVHRLERPPGREDVGGADPDLPDAGGSRLPPAGRPFGGFPPGAGPGGVYGEPQVGPLPSLNP